jgi:hypothetical protein
MTVGLAGAVEAAETRWVLRLVTFGDCADVTLGTPCVPGGVATGFFVMDGSSVTDWSITVSGGDPRFTDPYTYSPSNSIAFTQPDGPNWNTVRFSTPAPLTPIHSLALAFGGPLPIAGSVLISPGSRESLSRFAPDNFSYRLIDEGMVVAEREFTDPVLTPGVSPARTVHIDELRSRTDSLRTAAGLAAGGWSDPVLTPGVTVVRASHLQELHAAIHDVYVAAGRVPPSFAAVGTGTTISAAQIMELRAAVAAIE